MATTVTFTPTIDGYDSPNNNPVYSGSDGNKLLCGYNSSSTSATKSYTTQMKFDLSSLVGKTITSAVLKLYSYQVSGTTYNTSVNIAVYRNTSAINTSGGKPSVDASSAVSTTVSSYNQSYSWNITNIVKAEIADISKDYGISLRSAQTNTATTTKAFGSSRHATSSYRPVLTVVYEDVTYTVSYNKGANGTGTNTSDTKTHGVALTLKGAIFTRTGYTQTGWSTTDGGAKTYDLGGSYTANAAVTLYPFWTINTYTVSYNKGSSGTGTNTTDTKTYGVALTLKGAIFTRTNYVQSGWATSDGGAKVYELGGSYTTNAAVTLYPVWSDPASIMIKVNGTWVKGEPYVKVNGTWVKGTAYIKVDGVWKQGV